MITRIGLQGFKCFRELSLPLGRVTLLAGRNSAGKSTITQALLLLRQSDAQDRLDKDGLVLNGADVELGTGAEVLHGGSSEELRLELDYDDGASLQFAFGQGPTPDVLPPAPGEVDAADRRARAPFGRAMQYLSADRTPPLRLHPLDSNALRLDRLGPKGEHAVQTLVARQNDLLPHQDPRCHAAAKSRLLLDQVEAWLQEVSPGVRLEVWSDDRFRAAGLRFGFPGALGLGTDYHAPVGVGFGLSASLPVFLALLIARPDDLVVVDSPELHLHARAQRELMDLAGRAAAVGVQVMVETHSDHILNGLRLAVLKRRLNADDVQLVHLSAGKEPVYPRLAPDGGIDHWPEGFFDEWERVLIDLL